jgi:hypothetical protein
MDQQTGRAVGKLLEGVSVYAVPPLFKGNELTLKDAALSVYLYCCKLANQQKSDGQFVFIMRDAAAKTGYSIKQVRRALEHLLSKNVRRIVLIDSADFLPNIYALSNELGMPIGKAFRGDQPATLRTLMHDASLGYDEIPRYVMEHLKELYGPPLAIVLTGIKQAQDLHEAKYISILAEWKRMAHVYKDQVLHAALGKDEVKRVLHVDHRKGSRVADVEVFNPDTQMTLADNKPDAVLRARERAAISQYEADRTKKFTQAELEAWFEHEFPEATYSNDEEEFFVPCPQCHGTRKGSVRPRPTLRVRFDKGGVGVMACRAFIGKERGEDILCPFDTKGKVPYHLVAMRDHISPATALKRMRQFIEIGRAKTQNNTLATAGGAQ